MSKKKTQISKSEFYHRMAWHALVKREFAIVERLILHYNSNPISKCINPEGVRVSIRDFLSYISMIDKYANQSEHAAQAASLAFIAGRDYQRMLTELQLAKWAVPGEICLKSAAKGTVAAHGTREDREIQYAAWQTEIERLMTVHPKMSYSSACSNVAKKVGKSPECIDIHTRNPRPRINKKKVG